MKKIFILAILLFTKNILGQETITSSCFSDFVEHPSGSISSENFYTKFGIRFSRSISGSKVNNYKSFYLFHYLAGVSYQNYRIEDDKCDTSPSGSKFEGETTIKIELLKNGVLEELIHNKTYEEETRVSVFENDLRDYQFNPYITPGINYKLKFSVHIKYDPYSNSTAGPSTQIYDKTLTLSTGNFTIMGTPQIITPSNDEVIETLTPIIKWKNIDDASSYRVILGKEGESNWVGDGSGRVNGSIYDSGNITQNEIQIPKDILEPNTVYKIYFRYEINSYSQGLTLNSFKTREAKILQKNYEFYSEGVNPNSLNPNNYLNLNVPVRFKVKVHNELAESVTTLQGKLTSNTSGVTITDDIVNFSTIGSNLTGWSLDEFEFQVDETVAFGTNLEFQLTLNDGFISGDPWISNFSFPIQPTTNSTLTLVDNLANNNGTAEPGENAIKIEPKINNASDFILDKVRGSISTEQSFLTITSNNKRYNYRTNIHETITAKQTEVKPELPFEFNYASTADLQELNFDIELQGNLNNDGTLLKWTNSIVLNEGIEPAPVLVSLLPENNATEIVIDNNLSFTLNQNITAVAGKNISIYQENGTLTETIEVTDAKISISDATVNINPTDDFASSKTYYILIEEGAFINASNQPFKGIQSTTSWVFTTEDNSTCTNTWGSPTIYNTYTRALGIVTIDGEMATAEDKVAVFVDDELRGISDIVVNDNKAYMNLSIQGNIIETATFTVWDASECEEVPVSYTTQTDPPNTIGSTTFLPIDANRSTASVDDSLLTNNFIIYPNPTKSILNIENTSNFKINSLEMFNVLGEKIKNKKIDFTSIDISKFSNGVYFLKISTNKGSVTQKIIKE